MACKGQIYYYYYYYLIAVLTASEAFLPAVHKSNMKQRKFRPVLIALINSSLQLNVCCDVVANSSLLHHRHEVRNKVECCCCLL